MEVVWETDEPYIHTIEIGDPESSATEGEVKLIGLRILHYSKSVADNYALYINVSTGSFEMRKRNFNFEFFNGTLVMTLRCFSMWISSVSVTLSPDSSLELHS